jgi:hypothetical protein
MRCTSHSRWRGRRRTRGGCRTEHRGRARPRRLRQHTHSQTRPVLTTTATVPIGTRTSRRQRLRGVGLALALLDIFVACHCLRAGVRMRREHVQALHWRMHSLAHAPLLTRPRPRLCRVGRTHVAARIAALATRRGIFGAVARPARLLLLLLRRRRRASLRRRVQRHRLRLTCGHHQKQREQHGLGAPARFFSSCGHCRGHGGTVRPMRTAGSQFSFLTESRSFRDRSPTFCIRYCSNRDLDIPAVWTYFGVGFCLETDTAYNKSQPRPLSRGGKHSLHHRYCPTPRRIKY